MKALQRTALPVAFVLVWASGYIGGAVATSEIAPLTVTLWRFVFAASVLGLVAWRRDERWPAPRRELPFAVATGLLLFAVQFGALYVALGEHMPAATTALIACSAPLVVAAMSALLGWERLSPRQWSGVVL